MAVAAIAVGYNELRLVTGACVEVTEGHLPAVRRKCDRRIHVIKNALRRSSETRHRVKCDLAAFAGWIIVFVIDVVAVRSKSRVPISKPSGAWRNNLRLAAGRNLLDPQALLLATFDVCGVATIRRYSTGNRAAILGQLRNLHGQRIDRRGGARQVLIDADPSNDDRRNDESNDQAPMQALLLMSDNSARYLRRAAWLGRGCLRLHSRGTGKFSRRTGC